MIKNICMNIHVTCTWCVMYFFIPFWDIFAMRHRVPSALRKPNHLPLHRPHRKASCWASSNEISSLHSRGYPPCCSFRLAMDIYLYISKPPPWQRTRLKTMQPGLNILCLSARPVQNKNYGTWNHGVMYKFGSLIWFVNFLYKKVFNRVWCQQ